MLVFVIIYQTNWSDETIAKRVSCWFLWYASLAKSLGMQQVDLLIIRIRNRCRLQKIYIYIFASNRNFSKLLLNTAKILSNINKFVSVWRENLRNVTTRRLQYLLDANNNTHWLSGFQLSAQNYKENFESKFCVRSVF